MKNPLVISEAATLPKLNTQKCKPMRVCSVIFDSVTPQMALHQVPLSMEFPRQEYWSELPFPPLGDLPHPGTKLVSSESPA